jgi:hypothetical protein
MKPLPPTFGKKLIKNACMAIEPNMNYTGIKPQICQGLGGQVIKVLNL